VSLIYATASVCVPTTYLSPSLPPNAPELLYWTSVFDPPGVTGGDEATQLLPFHTHKRSVSRAILASPFVLPVAGSAAEFATGSFQELDATAG
jgi:hypothetical protein